MKKNKIVKAFMSFFLVFCMMFTSTTTIFAGGVNTSGGVSGQYQGGSHGDRWGIGSSYSAYGIKWISFEGSTTLVTDMGMKLFDRSRSVNSTKGAYLGLYSNDAKRWTWFNWAYWDEVITGAPSDYDWWYGGNGVYQEAGHGRLPDVELIQCAKDNGYTYDSNAKWYKNGNQKLDAVWIDGYQASSTDTKTSIVYVKDDNGVTVDRTNDSAQSLYDSPTTSSTYGDTTDYNEFNYKNTVTAKYQTVTRTKTYMTDGSKEWNITYSYKKGGITEQKKDFTYKVTQPQIEQSYFKPFDLNKNGLASDDDVRATYPDFNGSDPLKMSVDNYQGITDGSALKTLDTNTALKFNIRFENGQFGVPTAAQGGFDLADNAPGGSYANDNGTYNNSVINAIGANGTAKTGVFAYTGNPGSSTNINGNISKDSYWAGSLKANLSADTASLTYGDTEKVGGEAFSFDKGWTGGYFSFKTTKIGTYYLTNGGRKWWEMQYEKGKFYGYGMSYSGTITTGNIGNPTVTATNLYTRLASRNLVQPVLRGRFDAKTVGGDLG